MRHHCTITVPDNWGAEDDDDEGDDDDGCWWVECDKKMRDDDQHPAAFDFFLFVFFLGER